MTVEMMSAEIRAFLANCGALASTKNRDYHPEGVAFLEILRTSFDTDVRVEQDLWGRLSKQMSALKRFVIQGHVESEPPVQRMMDVANYMAILSVWHTYKYNILMDAISYVRGQECESVFGESGVLCSHCEFLAWLERYRQIVVSPPLG